MKLVSYEEMKQLPVGTVFYRMGARGGCVDALDGPYRKDYASDSDIFYCECGPVYLDKGYFARTRPERDFQQFCLSSGGTREGLFEDQAKYLVLDDADVAMLIANLLGNLPDDAESFVQIPDDLELP